MIGYHWSPHVNHVSISKHGLLVPTKHPKLVAPVVCSDGHRNPHISLGKTPSQAWALSGDMPWVESIWFWALYEVNLREIRYRTNGYELQVSRDIPRRFVKWIAERMCSHVCDI